MNQTPKANRLCIGIFGKRNSGKSSLMNTLLKQDISITSPIAGTTTDIVEKAAEIPPIGAILLIDTAGIDDTGTLGQKRIDKTILATERCDIALIVCDYNGWNNFEQDLFNLFKSKNIPVIAIINKNDVQEISDKNFKKITKYTQNIILTSTLKDKELIHKLIDELLKILPEEFITPPSLVDDIIDENKTVLLVTPIDKEAPKGRMILPQVQTIRALLDKNCNIIITKENGLKRALDEMKIKPDLVITDSQAFSEVANIIDKNTPLTSFSILFAKQKGDLKSFADGTKKIKNLKDGDKILICESCTHHEIKDDIGKVKIPALLKKITGKNLIFEHYASHEFATNIDQYALIIHCGGCMTNRREILSRIEKAHKKNIPITNYGMTIAYCKNILDKSLEPFNL